MATDSPSAASLRLGDRSMPAKSARRIEGHEQRSGLDGNARTALVHVRGRFRDGLQRAAHRLSRRHLAFDRKKYNLILLCHRARYHAVMRAYFEKVGASV